MRDRCIAELDALAVLAKLGSTELAFYERIGMEAFWHLPGWDPMNVRRPRMA